LTFVRERVRNGGSVNRGGCSRVNWCRGGVHRGGVHRGRGRVHWGSGGDDLGTLGDLGYETVDVVGGVRHGPDCAVWFGQAVLSLDHAIGQALLGSLVVTSGRVGHAVLVRVRRVRVDRVGDRRVSGVSNRGGVHNGGGRVSGGGVVLGLSGENGHTSKANCYLLCKDK